MASQEILTLQFGHYANFVGAHWWNSQELSFEYNSSQPSDIDHSVLFREGVTPQGQVTFTPRLLLVDLKDSLKCQSQLGDLYVPPEEATNPTVEWDGQLTREEEEKGEKNKFQKDLEQRKLDPNLQLENEVKVWSDFLYSRFHPRTIEVVKQFQHENSLTPFEVYPAGSALWRTQQFEEDFADKIRNYIEECDSFQGFHCLFDTDDAFSGLSTSCIQYLKDEYETKPLLVFPLTPSRNSDEPSRVLTKIINLLLTFDNLIEYSSLIVPLSTATKGWRDLGAKREFNHITYNNNLMYHSSAILAAALDTFTLKYRQKAANYALVDLVKDLSFNNQKLAAASLCLPFSMNKADDLLDCLNHWEGPLTKSITPNCEIPTDKVLQLYSLRGIPEGRLKLPPLERKQNLPAFKCKSIKEMMSFYVSCNSYASPTDFTVTEKALTVKTPFPKIFDHFVNSNGNLDLPNTSRIVESVPVLSGLHNGAFIGEMVRDLCDNVKKIKIKRFHQFLENGLDSDDYEEALNRLVTLRENYEDQYLI